MAIVQSGPAWPTMRVPRMSGRRVAQSTPPSSLISSQPRSGSVVRPRITWTKPADPRSP